MFVRSGFNVMECFDPVRSANMPASKIANGLLNSQAAKMSRAFTRGRNRGEGREYAPFVDPAQRELFGAN